MSNLSRVKSVALLGSLACGAGSLAWALYERHRHSLEMIMLNLAMNVELSDSDKEYVSEFLSTRLMDLKQQRWSLDGELLNYLESSNAPVSARVMKDYIDTNNKRRDQSEKIVREFLSHVRISHVEESED